MWSLNFAFYLLSHLPSFWQEFDFRVNLVIIVVWSYLVLSAVLLLWIVDSFAFFSMSLACEPRGGQPTRILPDFAEHVDLQRHDSSSCKRPDMKNQWKEKNRKLKSIGNVRLTSSTAPVSSWDCIFLDVRDETQAKYHSQTWCKHRIPRGSRGPWGNLVASMWQFYCFFER